jgi:Family of unknown function (DUF5343)
MSLTNAYLITTRNLEAFLNALQTAQAPERFTNKFLQDLEFSSSNDRLFIGLLKGLGFIDESGAPQQRYFDFLDQTQARQVLAQAIREAYDDVFRINKDAQDVSEAEIKNKLKTLTKGREIRQSCWADGEDVQSALRLRYRACRHLHSRLDEANGGLERGNEQQKYFSAILPSTWLIPSAAFCRLQFAGRSPNVWRVILMV